MNIMLYRAPLLLELFFNGFFLLFYSMFRYDRVPSFLSRELSEQIAFYSVWVVPFVLFYVLVTNYMFCRSLSEFIRKHVFSILIFVPIIITWGDIEFTYLLAAIHLFSSILYLYDSGKKGKRRSELIDFNLLFKFKLRPAQFVLVTFIGLILLGAFGLALPFSSKTGQSIGLVDALFMATSATCVTGLATMGVSENFSLVGQLIILLLVQVGGLGYMTLYSSMTILLGRSMGMKQKIVMQDLLDISSLEDLIIFIMDIIKYTLIIELWGGVILSFAFSLEGYDIGQAIYYGFFHSISAFCNAGFSLFDNSLEGFATNPLINGVISILIIMGGLGFIVLKEVKTFIVEKRNPINLSLHSKIVIVTNMFLILGGFFAIFFTEFLHSLDSYSFFDQVQVAFFQSVTTRTAGFNTIPIGEFHSHTLYLLTLFMFIGASPGSTGGGMKTTTFAILIQSIRATLKGSENVTFFQRKIPSSLVVRSTALSIISVIFVSMLLLVMMRVEPNQPLLHLLFEVVSAFATVGLSMGITPELSVMGKLIIVFLMLVGRVGPLTLVLAIGEKARPSGKVNFPEGRVMIG